MHVPKRLGTGHEGSCTASCRNDQGRPSHRAHLLFAPTSAVASVSMDSVPCRWGAARPLLFPNEGVRKGLSVVFPPPPTHHELRLSQLVHEGQHRSSCYSSVLLAEVRAKPALSRA